MAFRTNKTPVLQTKSASGSVATFNTALAMPLASCNIAVNAWQEGSGDPSPDNVRPIHGFNEVNATRLGKNLWGGEAFYQPLVANGAILDTLEKTVTYSGAIASATGKVFDKFKPNTQYTLMLHVKRSDNNGNMRINYTDGTSQQVLFGTETGDYQYLFTTPNTKSVLNISFRWISGTVVIYYDEVCLLEGVKTIDDFEPYTGNIYTIQLGQEVYGAEVDAVNGVAHVTNELLTFDGTEDWGEYGSAGFQSGVYSSLKFGNRQEGMANWLITTGTVNQFGLIIGLNNKKFYATHIKENISEVIDVTSWKQYLRAHPLQVVYPLAEPFDIQLTPTQIETLIGNNTIFCDTGDVDLTYNDLDIAKRGSFREVFKLPS